MPFCAVYPSKGIWNGKLVTKGHAHASGDCNIRYLMTDGHPMSINSDQTDNSTSATTRRIDAEVKAAITRLLPCNPTIVVVARSLSISVRTLQRRLAKGPLTFRQVLDECRLRQAELDLRRRDLSVTEISQRLGYSDPAHFVRAFRRWTGQPPTRFRAGLAQAKEVDD